MAIQIPDPTAPQIESIIQARQSTAFEETTLINKALLFAKEFYIVLAAAGANSGGSDSFFTDSTTFQNLNITEFIIDPDNFPGASFYLEVVCRAGASGDPLRTFIMDLYDVTGGATITNSEITTTSTEGAAGPGSLVRLRGSTNFRGNLTSGARTYILRYRTDTAGRFVDLYYARFIISYA